MGTSPELWGVETAAQELAQAIVRSVPVTVASVALWDQPGFSLVVKAVSTARQLPSLPPIGARVPLSIAPWHRVLFERQEPVCLEQDSLSRFMSSEEASFSLVPHLRSICLIPIMLGDEMVGVLALGEMRSREREPLTTEKRRQCRAILDEFLATSAHAWEAGRLRRQTRALSLLVRTVKQMLDVHSYDDVLACLASRVADWLGAPVAGLLLRAQPGTGNGMEVVARWQFPEGYDDGTAERVLLAVARAEGYARGPISVVRVSDDPLDPLHAASRAGAGRSRVCLPLLKGDQLLGVACLYVEGDLYPANWEREVFRWLAEIAAVWMQTVTTLREQRTERAWLELAACELFTTHHRTVLHEALAGVGDRVASLLPARVERAGDDLLGLALDEALLRRLAGVAAGEVAAVLAEVREAAGQAKGGAVAPVDANELARRAVDLARAKWGGQPGEGRASVEFHFEPSAEPVVVLTSVALVAALAHAIENAVEALPDGGEVRVRTLRDDGQVLISVADNGPGVAEEHRESAFTPLFSTKGMPHLGLGLSVVRSLAARHGGEARLSTGKTGGTTLVLRLPAASAQG